MDNEPSHRRVLHGLLKFGKAEHLDALQSDGTLFLNTLGYFKQLEADRVRGDSDEGLEAYHHVARIKVTTDPAEGALDRVKDWVIVHNSRLHVDIANDLHVFSAYAVEGVGVHSLDVRFREFGDRCLLIRNVAEFMRRFRVAVQARGLRMTHGLVDYVQREKHSGQMGPFRKFSEYEWQREFRVLIHPGVQGPITLNLGFLEDISSQCTTEILEEVELYEDPEPPN